MSPTPGSSETSRSISNEAEGADIWLKREMAQGVMSAPQEHLDVLNERVFAQWRDRCGNATMPSHQEGAAVLQMAGLRMRRPLWLGVTGLLAVGAITLGLWLERPDPVLEDLLQPDVLSQMAAGEL
jgi:hypothetical protein